MRFSPFVIGTNQDPPFQTKGGAPSFYHSTVNSSGAILPLSVAVKKNKEAESPIGHPPSEREKDAIPV
jgi:hypothetical protein